MKVSASMQQAQYVMGRLSEIQKRLAKANQLGDAEISSALSDAAYALGMMASTMTTMEYEHEKMKQVLRWFVKGDLEEHIDEIRAFIDAE